MSKHEDFPDPLWKRFNETEKHAGQVEPVASEADFNEVFEDSTYMCRIALAGPDGLLPSALDTIDHIKDKYGRENVAVSAVSVDPDTMESVVEGNGVVGVWVRSEAKAAIDSQ